MADGMTISRTDAHGGARSRLLNGYSTEITTSDLASLKQAASLMAKGAELFIASLPKDNPEHLIDAAIQVRQCGYEPVPHIAARKLKDTKTAENLLMRLAGDACVRRVLLIGGDRPDPAGRFSDAHSLLRTGLFEKHGVTEIGFGAYPEGHPSIPYDKLVKALDDKLALCADQELRPFLVTQLCFTAHKIRDHIRSLRARGVSAPVRIGLSGPVRQTTLLKYAMICGVGASIRAVKARPGAAAGLLSRMTPDALVDDIAECLVAEPMLHPVGAHFFTFGGLANSLRWVRAAQIKAEALALA